MPLLPWLSRVVKTQMLGNSGIIRGMNSNTPHTTDTVTLAHTGLKRTNKGKLVEESFSAPGRFVLSRTFYAYNEAGRRVKASHYNAQGSLYQSDLYSYDSQGRLVESISYLKLRRPLLKKAYSEHDSYGNWLKEVWLSQDREDDTSSFTPFMTVQRSITYF